MSGKTRSQEVAASRAFTKKINRLTEAARTAAIQAQIDTAWIIISTAQSYAPIDTGHLVGSGFVQKPRFTKGANLTTHAGFRAKYAMIVHETHPTQSRFLARAALEHAPDFANFSENGVREALRKEARITIKAHIGPRRG